MSIMSNKWWLKAKRCNALLKEMQNTLLRTYHRAVLLEVLCSPTCLVGILPDIQLLLPLLLPLDVLSFLNLKTLRPARNPLLPFTHTHKISTASLSPLLHPHTRYLPYPTFFIKPTFIFAQEQKLASCSLPAYSLLISAYKHSNSTLYRSPYSHHHLYFFNTPSHHTDHLSKSATRRDAFKVYRARSSSTTSVQ